MEFINASLINLELELNLNKNKTVFGFISEAKEVKAGGSSEATSVISDISEAKAATEETKLEAITNAFVPLLVHLQESRGWITEEKFTTRFIHNSHPLNGPTHESNWLIPKVSAAPGFGSLCVGSYPDSNKGYLVKLQAAGLNTFVCLNDEYGTRDKYGDYFEPYATKIPADRFIWKRIKDMKTGDDTDLLEVADEVVKRVKNGEHVYLHCAGGHGRTGGYAAIILHKLYPELISSEIFEYIQFAHDQRDGNTCSKSKWNKQMLMDPWAHHFKAGQVPSPQTLDQRNQVRSLLKEQLYR